MSALLQRARRGPGPLLVIVLVLNAAALLAHDPGLSALELSVSGNEIAATLSVSPADVAALAPTGDPSQAVARLRDIARGAVHLELDGELLVLEWQHVESDRSGTRIRLVYAPPQSNRPVRRLVVISDMPQQLSRGHRELVTITANERVAGEGMLDAETTSLAVDLVRSPPSRARQAWSFVTVGIHHILSGYDHLMFLAGLILAAVAVRELLIALTAFTIAHSISLALVAIGGVHAPPSIVEPLIAASIAWVGVENLRRRGPSAALRAGPEHGRGGRTRWWIVFAFGLVHGFGFAGALTELGFGSSAGDVALALLSFNAGVEIGQLAAAAVMLPLVWMVRTRPSWHARLQPVCSIIIVAAGTVWLIQRIW
jgi:HupE / UreJ protein